MLLHQPCDYRMSIKQGYKYEYIKMLLVDFLCHEALIEVNNLVYHTHNT